MIKSFFIAHKIDESLQTRAIEHCLALANRYGYKIKSFVKHDFFIALVVSAKDDFSTDSDSIEFSLGQIDRHPPDWDRYLKILINPLGLLIENDYAGSIPVFYSLRNGLVLSNIEPCVYLASDSSLNDLSPENMYGFLRYSHFIWDETAWKHIKQMLPDSRYQFNPNGKLLSIEYLESVRATDSRVDLSDKKVADELYELNQTLVLRSLADADEIILPLSSGYDSRMIYAVLANDKILADRTRCFTYGTSGSIEVEGGRRLTGMKGVVWHHIELPCRFLDLCYLAEVSDIFGASLHMHGMYQLEFHKQIKTQYGFSSTARLTSGFMTGVPAGQHYGLLQMPKSCCRLSDAMNNFSQSKVWSDADLEKMPIFSGKRYLEKAEERFRLAYDRFNGEPYQKAVMFDIWTRQRNFISYYPRVFEWLCPVSSPHMCAEYASFFMSLSKYHLSNRKAVELMFLRHYQDIARVASNSHGISSMGSQLETGLFFLSRVLNRLGFFNPLPKSFHNAPIEFDIQAVRNCKEDSFYPLLEDGLENQQFADMFGGVEMFQDLYSRAINGDVKAYERAVTFQSVALNSLRTFSCQDQQYS